ncbi:MAG: ferritin-like domain-containing protein [Gammaproteobacteria bacterium]
MRFGIDEGSKRKADFLTDIKTIRERARQYMQSGAVTLGYPANRAMVVKLLNTALATEIVCVLRYKRHYYMADGMNSASIAAEFLEHANDEQGHADQIAKRIVQLNGEPNCSPEHLLERSHSEYVEGHTLAEMVQENLVAERIAIDTYREMIDYLGGDDSTTRCMLEGILAVEEGHAEDMANLLKQDSK